MKSRTAILILVFCLATAAPAVAQTSLADIKAKLGEKTSELEEVDALLANPDRNQRLAAMKLLIESGNPVFVKRAREVGLFSSDTEMQAAALAATLEAGGPFRMLFDLTTGKEADTRVGWWLNRVGGGWDADGKLGTFTFSTGPYDAEKKCWTFRDDQRCAAQLTGVTISIQSWSNADGSLTLTTDGSMRGSFRVEHSSAAVPVTIPLIE